MNQPNIVNNGKNSGSGNNIQQLNIGNNNNNLIPNKNKNVNVNLNNDDLKDIPICQDIVDKIIASDDLNNKNKNSVNICNNININVNGIVNNNECPNDCNKKQLNGGDKIAQNSNNNNNTTNIINGDRERNSQPNIENEVEIELPSSQPSQPLNLSQSDLILRNVSDSSITFSNEQQNGIEDNNKWAQV